MQTVLLTGATGYIGSWVCRYLLEAGYRVRATVRNRNDKAKYAHLEQMAAAAPGELEIWEADLLTPNAFDEAAKGCEIVFHIASPFRLDVKDVQRELLDPALKGTQNVLQAATRSGTVRKVVLTSSGAAIYGDVADMQAAGLECFTEEHWNTTSSPTHQPYSYSKLIAEKAAWELANAQPQWQLVVINPTMVMGPSLTPYSQSESLKIIKDFLKGQFAMGVPDLKFGFVDVRDVARAHLLAAQQEKAAGRHLLSAEVLGFIDIGKHLRQITGRTLGLPFMVAPKALFWLIAPLFGVTRKFVEQNVGFPLKFDNQKSINALGISYIPIATTLRDMVEAVKQGS